MERKYDNHNSGYPICIKTEWEPKDAEEVSVNKMVIKNMNKLNTGK